MATSLEELEKVVQIDHIHKITYHLVKNQENRSSGSRDNWSSVKKKEITEGKMCSPVGKFAEWAK